MPRDWVQLVKIFENEQPHFIVRLADVNVLNRYNIGLKNVNTTMKYFASTNVIDFEKKSHIAFKIQPGVEEYFIYFKYIQFDFDLLFLFTMILLSIILLVMQHKRTMKDLCYYMFSLSTLLINSVNLSTITKKINYKLIFVLGPWFFSSFLITITFNNLLLDYLVRAIPEQLIDSWEDLAINNDKIIVEDIDFMTKFSSVSETPLAKRLRGRMEFFRSNDLLNITFVRHLKDELFSGRAAYIKNRLTLIYHIFVLQKVFKLDDRLVESLHVSRQGGPDDQYFMLYPSTTPIPMVETFNE